MGTPQVPLQTMSPVSADVVTVPVVGLVLPTLVIEEGSSALIRVQRQVVTTGTCSVDMVIDAPGGLLASPAAKDVDFATGVTELSFSIVTNVQAGVQGERAITVRLINPVGCVIAVGRDTGAIMVRDKTVVTTGWWKVANRSGRNVSGGVGYEFGAATSELATKVDDYETQVAYVDAGVAWTVDPENVLVIAPSATAVDDAYTLTPGVGTQDLDVLNNDATTGGRKELATVTPKATPAPPMVASDLSIVGTIPTQKVRVRKNDLLPARQYHFTYRLQVENEAGVYGDANVILTMEAAGNGGGGGSGKHVIPYAKPAKDVVLSTNGTAIANGNALMNAYSALTPGSRLIIPAVSYDLSSGEFTFGKTTGINQSNPIVIEVTGQKYGQAEFKRRVRVMGPDHTVIGLFASGAAGATVGGANCMFGIGGARSRVSRCKAIWTVNSAMALYIISAAGAIADFCEGVNSKGGNGSADGRGIGLEPTTLPKSWKIIRNYMHDFNDNPGVNFHEPVQCGRGGGGWDQHCLGLVLENLIWKCTNEGEAFSIKSAENEMTGNCLLDCGGQARFTMRFGEFNKWYRNISDNSDGFNCRGFDTLYHSNVVKNGGTFDINSGKLTQAEWENSVGAGGFPCATTTTMYYNNGPVVLGTPSSHPKPCKDTTIRSHTGTISNQNSIGTDSKPSDPPPGTAGAKQVAYQLKVSDVGPLSNEGPV